MTTLETDAYCPHCGQSKPIDAFGPDARKANGRQSYCRDCRAAKERDEYRHDKLRDLRTRFTMYGLDVSDDRQTNS